MPLSPGLRLAAACAAVAGAFGLGIYVGHDSSAKPQAGPLDVAASTIASQAATPTSVDELRRAAVSGMLMSIGDPWGSYLDSAENTVRLNATAGAYAGVGAWLHEVGSQVAIASVTPGGPASISGLRVGDRVVSVAGTSTKGLTAAAVGRLLTGDPGSIVTVTVRRGNHTTSLRVARGTVDSGVVSATRLAGGVLDIRVPTFVSGTGRQVRNALRHSGSHVTGIILDLRGNPGGLLVEGVDTASAFLNGGPVVTLDRRGAAPQTFNAASGGSKLPLVVLVDHGTASAAEIVAAALQERGRAVLVGERTFGKAAVQQVFTLPTGGAVELTVGHYLTPNGRHIDGVGITPDLVVSDTAGDPVQRALAVLSGYTASAGN